MSHTGRVISCPVVEKDDVHQGAKKRPAPKFNKVLKRGRNGLLWRSR